MDQREERVFLDVVSDATKRAPRKAEVSLPGYVYRAITWIAVLDQGDVQRLSHPTCPSAKNISKDTGMRETVRGFYSGNSRLLVGMDSMAGISLQR
jgi:hypothetical protein